MIELVEPKFEMDAFKKTIARTHVLPDINGKPMTHLFYDAADKLIAVGHGPGPYFSQYFPLEHLANMKAYMQAKFDSEEIDRVDREVKAAAKQLAIEAAQAEKDARRLAMKALHAKPE